MDKKILTGIIASLGASLCCITPVLAVLAGSAGLASTFLCFLASALLSFLWFCMSIYRKIY